MTNQLHKLLLLIVAAIFTGNAYAYGVEIDKIYYKLDKENQTASVTNGSPLYSGDVTIPASITLNDITYSVTSIGDYAFYTCSGLTSIDIPSSVTSIGEHAFQYCSGLTSIDIPSSVTYIGSRAFWGCSALTSIEIPEGVTSIGDYEFYLCSGLTSIDIPSSVTSIGNYTFSDCSGLTSINIPSSVTSIGNSAFYGCSGLTSIEIPEGVTSIGNYTFSDCSGLTSVNIPSSVTSIGDYAFRDCSGLTSIDIPSSVTSIGNGAFYGCSGLTSISIPEGVTSIGAYAFKGCNGLTSVYSFNPNPPTAYMNCFDDFKYLSATLYVPQESVEAYRAAYIWCNFLNIQGFDSIGNTDPFEAEIDGIKYLLVPENQTASVRSGDDKYTGDVTIPASITHNGITYSVTSIGDIAFYDCSGLTSISIPSSVTSIGERAFHYCYELTSIYSFNPEPPYASDCFNYGHIEHATLYVPTKAIEAYRAADGWSNFINIQGAYTYEAEIDGIYYILNPEILTASVISGDDKYTGDVTIPASITHNDLTYSVTSIERNAFSGCSGLTSISIPEGVTSIERSTFSFCRGLTSIDIPSSVTSIGRSAFLYCNKLTSINIPSSVTSIGEEAFSGCSGLTSVSIPEGVTSIGARAFKGCSGLTAINVSSDNPAYCSIDGILYDKEKTTLILCPGAKTGSVSIPEGVTRIEASAFSGCSGLTSVNIPSSVTSIGESAFSYCSGLTAINISSDNPAYCSFDDFVYNKEKTTLIQCPGAKTGFVSIPEGVTKIEASAFAGCSGLTSVMIPEGVTRIEPYTFSVCSGLASINLPSSVTYIGECAFDRCSGLTSIKIPEGVTGIGAYAFSGCSGLTSIYVFNPKHPDAYQESFDYDHYQSVTLYVPQESVEAYGAANVWKKFENIQGFDTTGIEGVEAENGNRPAAYYDANGRKSATPHHGVNIVRMTDGTTRKVMMK